MNIGYVEFNDGTRVRVLCYMEISDTAYRFLTKKAEYISVIQDNTRYFYKVDYNFREFMSFIDFDPLFEESYEIDRTIKNVVIFERMQHYEYEVNVGTGIANGEIIVSEDATDGDIALAILNDLYEYHYSKIDEGSYKDE